MNDDTRDYRILRSWNCPTALGTSSAITVALHALSGHLGKESCDLNGLFACDGSETVLAAFSEKICKRASYIFLKLKNKK